MPQRADKIVVHLGHRIFFLLARQLRVKQLGLQIRIVQLGVRIGHFHALHDQFETLGDRRIIVLSLGQRTNAGGVVHHKYRTGQLVFHLLFKHLALDHVGMLAGGFEANFFRQGLDAGVIGPGHAGVLLEIDRHRFAAQTAE